MPKLVDSPPPEVLGVVELDYDAIASLGFSGHVRFRTHDGEPYRPPADVVPFLEPLQPLWSITDEDYRRIHSVGSGLVSHTVLIDVPTYKGFSLMREMASLATMDALGNRDWRPGFAHIDARDKPGENGIPDSTRYTHHPIASTDIFVGKPWFLLSDPDKKHRLTAALAAFANIPFIALQKPFAGRLQLEPNTVVRIDGRVHRTPRRPHIVGDNRSLITDTVHKGH